MSGCRRSCRDSSNRPRARLSRGPAGPARGSLSEGLTCHEIVTEHSRRASEPGRFTGPRGTRHVAVRACRAVYCEATQTLPTAYVVSPNADLWIELLRAPRHTGSPTSHRRCFVGFPPLRSGHAPVTRAALAGTPVMGRGALPHAGDRHWTFRQIGPPVSRVAERCALVGTRIAAASAIEHPSRLVENARLPRYVARLTRRPTSPSNTRPKEPPKNPS
jgi:hypothetical protein